MSGENKGVATTELAENERTLMENKTGMMPRNRPLYGTNPEGLKQGGGMTIYTLGGRIF